MSRDSPYGVAVAVADDELVDVALRVIVPVAVAVEVSVLVAVSVAVSVCVSLVPVPVTVSVADFDFDVVVDLDLLVEVDADEVVEAVIEEDAVAVAVDVEDVSMVTVCASSAIGMTSQLVPSEIANSAPPIFSLAVPKPMLSAVRLLNTTNPSSAPSTHMLTSATLTNRHQLPLLTSDAVGSVKVITLPAPRVINTEPKSLGLTV